jgi:hypothetical protein
MLLIVALILALEAPLLATLAATSVVLLHLTPDMTLGMAQKLQVVVIALTVLIHMASDQTALCAVLKVALAGARVMTLVAMRVVARVLTTVTEIALKSEVAAVVALAMTILLALLVIYRTALLKAQTGMPLAEVPNPLELDMTLVIRTSSTRVQTNMLTVSAVLILELALVAQAI